MTAARVSGMWEELFGEKDRFPKDVRLFLSALASKMKLISLLAVEDAAGTDPTVSTGAYRTRLFDEMKECHQALDLLRSVLHRTVRLEYSLGMSDWMPASMLLKGKKEKSNRLLATLRTLLKLEDRLEQLHLPFAGLDMMPQYDLIAERKSDGSLEVGLERIVAPVEVALG
ncbi:MAG: hypothetical protein M5U22_18710 [Thermoleophilia bacterium]|nr:hypothetical protein [Thermoleophilia bacterium]